MSNLIDKVIRTRKITEDILIKSLSSIDGLTEIEIHKKLLEELEKHTELFPEGYYSPPPAGIAVILDQKPFKRLHYDSLRNSLYWPNNSSKFEPETVAMVYLSPIDRETNMIGDMGLTIYRGSDSLIKEHVKMSYEGILNIAKHAQIGMTFKELCTFATDSFEGKLKITKWTAMNSDPNQSVNLGHTVPGSLGENFAPSKNFEEAKENIRVRRIPFIDTQNFTIPGTCAFTVESRTEDLYNGDMPSVHFHFMVCFDKGKKTILDNFGEIFKIVGMDYMDKK